MGGEEDLVRGDAAVGDPLLPPQHPDDDVRHAVLGLHSHPHRDAISKTCDTSLQHLCDLDSREQILTSSLSCLSLSSQASISDNVSLISVASSLMRLAASFMVVKALSRRFLSCRSSVVRLSWPSSGGVGKLREAAHGLVRH